MRHLAWILALTCAVGCGKKSSDEGGLPPLDPAAQPAPVAPAPAAPAPSGGAAPGAAPAPAPAPAAPAPAAAGSEAANEARRLFATVCATCHGPQGRGDGPAAANLNPRPRDYTDAAWQASVQDEDIRKIILEGGLALGKSPIMPAQPQLADKPEIVAALVTMIRGFAH